MRYGLITFNHLNKIMKRLFKIPSLLLFAASLLFLNACNEDIGTGSTALSPTISFNSGTDLLTGDATLAAGAPIKVQITAQAGDNDMQYVEFKQDGARIVDISRIKIDGVPASSAAPLLSDTEVSNFTWDVEITTDGSASSVYSILVSDASNNIDQVSLTITTEAVDPSISFIGEGSTVQSSPGNADKKVVTVMSNGVDLATLTILENDVVMTDLSRIYYGDLSNNFTSNPMDITGDDVAGFVKDIYIRQFTTGTSKYTIQVENIGNKTASASYFINTGSAIDATITATLLSNASGPDLGGLDLYTGTNVSVNSADATIIDLGINGNPAATNWIQKFRHNGTGSIKELSADQISAGFDFAAIQYKEQILSVWDNAVSPADDQQPTNKVQVGDVFIILNDNDYFLIQCTDVQVTTNNNEDYFNFDIKQALY